VLKAHGIEMLLAFLSNNSVAFAGHRIFVEAPGEDLIDIGVLWEEAIQVLQGSRALGRVIGNFCFARA
jgi:hypothetical protein